MTDPETDLSPFWRGFMFGCIWTFIMVCGYITVGRAIWFWL